MCDQHRSRGIAFDKGAIYYFGIHLVVCFFVIFCSLLQLNNEVFSIVTIFYVGLGVSTVQFDPNRVRMSTQTFQGRDEGEVGAVVGVSWSGLGRSWDCLRHQVPTQQVDIRRGIPSSSPAKLKLDFYFMVALSVLDPPLGVSQEIGVYTSPRESIARKLRRVTLYDPRDGCASFSSTLHRFESAASLRGHTAHVPHRL